MSDVSPLRQALDRAMAEQGCSMKDLTVLATQNDPFRIDTPANHRDGEWLAINAARLGYADRTIHLRGLHYVLSTDAPTKPNGDTYRNTDADWRWLQEKAADAARWLGFIPFDRIVDQRNAAPTVRVFEQPEPWAYLNVGVHVDIPAADDITPEVGINGFVGVQPYKLVLVGEKSSLDDVLAPIAATYKADLYLPTGCMSDTLIHQIAKIGAADGRPMAVFYFADCDPSGWNMAIEVCRKLQAFTTKLYPDLDFEVYRVALTPDQVREYGLPSTPLKDTERRADAWQAAMQVEQTEIDALAALQPALLRQIARDALDPFFDRTLDRRVLEAQGRWLDEAQAALEERVDPAWLDEIRAEAETKLTAMREQVAELNTALQIDTSGLQLPPMDIPAAVNGRVHGTPLLDSRWSFAEQCRALIDSKAYHDGGAS